MNLRESKLYRTMRYVILVLMCAFVVIPIVPVIFTALKTGAEMRETNFLTPPTNWFNFHNFRSAMEMGRLIPAFGNTMFIVAISLLISCTLACMVGYVLQRYTFIGRKVVFNMFAMTMFIPVVTTQVVVFRIIHSMGLVNSRWSVILLYSGVSIVDIYIVSNLLASIPTELDEAGLIDGAGAFKTFFRIIMPLLKPAIVTMAVIKGIGFYNDFYIPNLYLISRHHTLTVALNRFFTIGLSAPFEVLSAAVLIATVPVIIMFLFLQRFIYDGLSGSTKG